MNRSKRRRSLRSAFIAATVMLAFTGTAQALPFTSGDVLLIVGDFGPTPSQQVHVNLGQQSNLTPGYSETFTLPGGFPATSSLSVAAVGIPDETLQANVEIAPSFFFMQDVANISYTTLGDANSVMDAALSNAYPNVDSFFNANPGVPQLATTGNSVPGGLPYNATTAADANGYCAILNCNTNALGGVFPVSVAAPFGAGTSVMVPLYESYQTLLNYDDSVAYQGGTSLIADLQISVNGDQLTVSVIPEPATAMLLGIGLFGLVIQGRRRHHGV